MRIGFALPQYDYSITDESPLTFPTIVECARHADELGFDSLWLSDHLFLDIAKYGGPADPQGCYDPLVTLAAVAQTVSRPRLGTLVLLEALRPAAVLAKGLATLDRVSGGRLDVGMGAGWYEPEYGAIGMTMPTPAERLERLAEAVDVVTHLLDGGPYTSDGRFHATRDAHNLPAALQRPRPPVFVGGKGDRLLRLAVERADGWNTCWAWTPEAYRERLDVVHRECDRIGRDPATFWRSLGLYALVGEDQRDLERRYARLQANTPKGVIDGVSLDQWRQGRLVGTVQEVRDQVDNWATLGVDTIIVGVGALPFQVGALDDLDVLAAALID